MKRCRCKLLKKFRAKVPISKCDDAWLIRTEVDNEEKCGAVVMGDKPTLPGVSSRSCRGSFAMPVKALGLLIGDFYSEYSFQHGATRSRASPVESVSSETEAEKFA